MEEVFKSVEDVTSWLEEKGFSADIVDAFEGMHAWVAVSAYSIGTTYMPGYLDTHGQL